MRTKIGRNDPCPCNSGRKLKRCHGSEAGLAVMALHDNLNTVLSCTRPIFCKSNTPGYELFGRGTGFIVRAAGAIWIATAKHCLRDKPLDDIAIPRFLPPPGTAPIGAFFTPIGIAEPVPDDDEDTAGFDVALIRTNERDHPHAIDLDDDAFFAPLDSARRGDPVRISGFPAALDNSIDAPSGAVRVQAFHTDGRYAELTASKYLHRFSIDRVGKVTDLDGMSGSPLFYVQGHKYFFGGVVVRGNASSRIAHFVDGRWLRVLAERMTEDMVGR